MFDLITIAFWFLVIIAVVHPIYSFIQCYKQVGKEIDVLDWNFYLKNHSKPSTYLGICVCCCKGMQKVEDKVLLVEVKTFTLGLFFFYWQFNFKTYQDA